MAVTLVCLVLLQLEKGGRESTDNHITTGGKYYGRNPSQGAQNRNMIKDKIEGKGKKHRYIETK